MLRRRWLAPIVLAVFASPAFASDAVADHVSMPLSDVVLVHARSGSTRSRRVVAEYLSVAICSFAFVGGVALLGRSRWRR